MTKAKAILLAVFVVGGAALSVGAYVFRAKNAGPAAGLAGAAGTSSAAAEKSASKARAHVPKGCDIVVRVEVARALEVPAVERHLAPVLEQLVAAAPGDPEGARRVADLLEKTGIAPRSDVKDVVVCGAALDEPAGRQRLAVVAGGDLRPEAVVPALARMAKEGEEPLELVADGRPAVQTKAQGGQPVFVGQTQRGAVVVASDRALFDEAVRESTNHDTAYGLPAGGDVALYVGPALWGSAPVRAGADGVLARHARSIARAVAVMTLATGAIELRIVVKDAAVAAPLAEDMKRALRELEGKAASLPPAEAAAQAPDGGAQAGADPAPGPAPAAVRKVGPPGAAEALAGATVKVEGEVVLVEMTYPQAGIEVMGEQLARTLRAARQRGTLAL